MRYFFSLISNRFLPFTVFIASACFILSFVGCEENPQQARAETTHVAENANTVFAWPTTEAGHLLQFTKHSEDVEKHSGLALMSTLPGNVMPDEDITPINVKQVTAIEVEELIDAGWVLLDVRKDADLQRSGVIPGSVHLAYTFEGGKSGGITSLNASSLSDVSTGKGYIFVCNGEKCPRSFNASVAAVEKWGVSSSGVYWFRAGVGAWTRSPLIPVVSHSSK